MSQFENSGSPLLSLWERQSSASGCANRRPWLGIQGLLGSPATRKDPFPLLFPFGILGLGGILLKDIHPKRILAFQECHKCHGRGRYKCSGCHGAGTVSHGGPYGTMTLCEHWGGHRDCRVVKSLETPCTSGWPPSLARPPISSLWLGQSEWVPPVTPSYFDDSV